MRDNSSSNKIRAQLLSSEFTLKDLIRVILFRKWIMIAILVVFLGSAFCYISIKPAVYKSSVILMRDVTYDRFPSSVFGTRDYYDYGISEGQILMLKSRQSLEEISRQLRQNQGINVSIMDLRSSLSLMTNKNDSNIVSLTATAPSPKQAWAIASVASEVFISKVAEMKSLELSQGADFLKAQMDQVEQKMHETEKALNEFRDREGLVSQQSYGSDTSGLLGKLGELQTQSVETENEIELTKSQLKALENLIAEKKRYAQSELATGLPSEIDQLKQRLISMQLELNTKLETLTEKDPEVITLKKKIDLAQNQLKTEFNKMLVNTESTTIDPISELQSLTQQIVTLTVTLRGLESKSALINERLKKFREEHPEIASKQVELIRLERQSRIFEQAYTALASKYQDMRLMQQMKSAGLKIVDNAYLPTKPVAPRKKLIMVSAGVLGLFFGLMISLFIDYVSDVLRTKEDIERHIELPVLGVISNVGPFKVPESITKRKTGKTLLPEKSSDIIENSQKHKDRQKPSKEILDLLSHSLIFAPNGNTKTPSVESYWNLAMSIKYANLDNPYKSILITSSVPSERKTTTASNLAIVNAKLGAKVLLIDADFKRPMLHRIFQQSRRPGLSDILTIDDMTNGKTFDYVAHGSIRSTVIENLYLLPVGSSVPNSDALVSSERLENLIKSLKEKFDLIIVDSAPMLIIASVTALCKEVDGVLLVIKSGKTKRKMALASKEILNNIDAKIIGTVLTGVDYNIQYGYYYRRYYNYYYHQKDDDQS
ncbi:MAG: GumC family protein [Candidatus Poribacteria bacterium]